MTNTIFVEDEGIKGVCDSCGQSMPFGGGKVVSFGSATKEVCQECVDNILQDSLFEPETNPDKE